MIVCLKRFANIFNGLSVKVKSALILGVALFFSVVGLIVCSSAGSSLGKAVGFATGSFRAVTESLPEGYRDGKEQGLSAEDTRTKIVSYTQGVGKLEVLVAHVKLKNFHQVGNQYAALYTMPGNVVFSINMSECNIAFSLDGSSVDVILPEVQVDVNLDDKSIETVAIWQNRLSDGSTIDGIKAYINSRKNLITNTRESIANYDELMMMAKATAEEQIRHLLSGVLGKNVVINVSYREGR